MNGRVPSPLRGAQQGSLAQTAPTRKESTSLNNFNRITLSSRTTGQRMEEMHRLTEQQLKDIQHTLSEMQADLHRIAAAPPPPHAGLAGPKAAPPGFAPPKTHPKSPVPKAGPKMHHLEPIPPPEQAPKRPAEPAPKRAAVALPPPPAKAPATEPKPKAKVSPGPGDSMHATFSLGGAEVVLDSPDASSSDDSSDDAVSPAHQVKAPAPPPPAAAAAADGTRTRQGVGFNKAPAGGPAKPGSGPPRGAQMGGEVRVPGHPAPHRMSEDDSAVVVGLGRSAAKRGAFKEDVDDARAVDGQDRASRRQNEAVRSSRDAFFGCFPRLAEVVEPEKLLQRNYLESEVLLPGAPCSWLCCIAIAISYVSKVPTPLEKILRTNHMGLHNVGLGAITLAELYDYTNDYIHARFHRTLEYNKLCSEDEFDEDEEAAQWLTPEELANLAHVHCEMATFDTQVIDPDEQDFCVGMGEHPPIPSLAQFRKELVEHGSQNDSLYIFNFDPYIIEESELRLRSNMAETEEEAAAIMASARHSNATKGSFGILLNFNVVQRTITFAVPHLTAEQYPTPACESEESQQLLTRFQSVLNYTVLEEHTVSMQTLYDALKKRDTYSLLSRGFVRVFINKDFAPKVAPIFPLFVVDGSSAGGLMTNLLDVNIAPHILGLAMLHHLTITFILSDSARRKQSSRNLLSKVNVCDVKLRGIPLTKIVQQLRLPLSMVVSESTSSSVATAFNWYYCFLQQLQVIQEVRIGLVLAERRGGAQDGQPNIFEEDFTAHVKMAVESESVMLIGFDVNIAQNVRISDRATPAHFAIVIGLDEARGVVRLADVNVKRFRKTWHIPLQRLYNATMGYGYMIASKEKKIIKALNDKEFQSYALSRACFGLAPAVGEINGRFEYPLRTYAVTVLADAVSRLGYRSDVERFLNFCGFHYTYFLSRHIPLQAAAFVLQNYSHYALDDELSVVVTHYDYHEGNEPPAGTDPADPLHKVHTMETLLEAITTTLAAADETIMIVKYDHIMVQEDEAVWNGSNGSSFAIVVAFDPATQLVTLSDGNPSSFHRVWACPLALLFRAICSWSAEDIRARGTIHIVKRSQEHIYENTKGYDMAHCMVHHPFKPIFSATCSCLALAATEMMLNIQVPQMLGGAPLAVEDQDEKKRYMRYNNIFSSEDFLYALPHFRVHDFQQEAHHAVDIAEVANIAFQTLKLPLLAKSVTDHHAEVLTDPSAFIQACKGLSGLMTIVLVRYDTDKLHGVPGSSVAIVNRVLVTGEDDEDEDEAEAPRPKLQGAGSVQLLEGDPARWGIQSDLQAETLMAATLSMVLIQEVEAQEEMFD